MYKQVLQTEPPAPGYRDIANGTLGAVGRFGHSWSSAVNNYRACYLNIHDDWFDTRNTNNRTYGFQVRCLLE